MSTCAAHARASTSTCVRCGLFLCDWCEKLAPSWGPGLCPACQRHRAPSTVRLTRLKGPTMVLVMLSLWGGLAALASLFRVETWTERAASMLVLVGVVVLNGYIIKTHRKPPPPRKAQ